MMHLLKNFVILSDMLIEKESVIISARHNFMEFKNLISKRKTFFDIKSTFNLEERHMKISESFQTVANYLVQRTNPSSDLSFSQPNTSADLESLLQQVLSTILSDELKSKDKESRLCDYYRQIRLDYRQIAGADLNESVVTTGRSTVNSSRQEKENFNFGVTQNQPNEQNGKPQASKGLLGDASKSPRPDAKDRQPDKGTPDFKSPKDAAPARGNSTKSILKNGVQTTKFEGSALESVQTAKASLVGSVPALLPPANPKYRYSLVLDLDETLVHYDEVQQHFYVRPHARDFLKRFGRVFEIIIYTAATKDVGTYLT